MNAQAAQGPAARELVTTLAIAGALLLGIGASWPIYESPQLWSVAIAAVLIGYLTAWFSVRRAWGALVTAAVLAVAFALTVVPVAVPSALQHLPDGIMPGLRDGLSATVLGWKQLLTLTLPVGSYQATLVPAYLVFLLTSFGVALLALRAPRFASFAAIPMVLPVAFGTIFGASQVSAAIAVGPITLRAPREIALWVGAALLGVVWVWWSSGVERRAALRRGRAAGTPSLTGGRLLRGSIGAVTVLAAAAAGFIALPVLDATAREVPRERVDPELVVKSQSSPLASYRTWKHDDAIDTPLFTVTAEGELPSRIPLAVLNEYNGVDFHVASDDSGVFTRFPSASRLDHPTDVTITIDDGYHGIWLPAAELGSVPEFSGPRAIELAESLYVNRHTGAAIVVAGDADARGLEPGDTYRVTMNGETVTELLAAPLSDTPLIETEALPELTNWVEAQEQPATAAGLAELVQRLRDRGYLSHSLSESDGATVWLERLAVRYGTQFESSAGGHSVARIERIFEQLNAQERVSGSAAAPEALVAAVGDDEQFATAAALIARVLGFESRVVVGVRLVSDASIVPGVAACESVCTGEHVAAWAEVRGDTFEWVALDATPQVTLRPAALEEGEQLPEFPTIPQERDAEEVDPPLGIGERSDAPAAPQPTEEESAVSPVLKYAVLALAAALLLALVIAFVPLAKLLRRQVRRRAKDPEIRALGAWNEMVDRARDTGLTIPARASRSAVAELLGTAPARWAAQQVDRAVFSPSGITDTDADWVWAAGDADWAEREADLAFWGRLRAIFGLRSYREQRALPAADTVTEKYA